MQTVKLTRPDPGIAVVALSRPDAANAMSTLLAQELTAVWTELSADEGLRCVILTGEGKAFCAGADLKERNGMTDEAWAAQHKVFQAMIRAELAVPVPVIAAVNGPAMGGGGEMVLAADFAIAAEGARLGWPEVRLGFFPGLGGPSQLARAVGVRRATELLTTGRPIFADEALSWGLVNRVVPPDQLMEEALILARQIAANAPLAVRALKRTLRDGAPLSQADAYARELDEYGRLFVTADRKEGVAAFNEKRPPKFEGR